MLPEDARLAHDLLALRQRAAALEAAGNTQQASDLADVVFLVDGRCFRLILIGSTPAARPAASHLQIPLASLLAFGNAYPVALQAGCMHVSCSSHIFSAVFNITFPVACSAETGVRLCCSSQFTMPLDRREELISLALHLFCQHTCSDQLAAASHTAASHAASQALDST